MEKTYFWTLFLRQHLTGMFLEIRIILKIIQTSFFMIDCFWYFFFPHLFNRNASHLHPNEMTWKESEMVRNETFCHQTKLQFSICWWVWTACRGGGVRQPNTWMTSTEMKSLISQSRPEKSRLSSHFDSQKD